MEDLEKGKEVYVPSDGTILPRTTVEFKDGETVFDVLKRACASKIFNLSMNILQCMEVIIYRE